MCGSCKLAFSTVLFRNLVVSLFGLLVALAIAETFARFWYDGLIMTGTLMTNDDSLAFRHRRGAEVSLYTPEFSNHFAIDHTFGVRVKKSEDVVKPSPSFAIYGDSMAFGYGVEFEQTYSEILNRKFGSGTVVNVGTYAYGPGQEFQLARELRRTLRPKNEVVLFYAGNDFENFESHFELVEDKNGRIVFTDAVDPGGSFRRLLTNSFLYPLVTKLHLFHWLRNVFLQGGASPLPVHERFPHYPKEWINDKELGKITKLTTLFEAWSDEVGRDNFYLVLIPHQQSFELPDERVSILYSGLKGKVQVFTFLDVLTNQERQQYSSLFYPHDAHFNQRGHQVLADVLSRILPMSRDSHIPSEE